MNFYETTESDRQELRNPRGDVVHGKEELIEHLKDTDYRRLVCVGDRVSLDVASSDIDADVSIVDGRIQRRDIGDSETEKIEAERTLRAENPPGAITEDAWRTVRKAFSLDCSTKIEVGGEEDLLGLPATFFASPDSLVVYGHWKEGAVIMRPDQDNKEFVEDILELERSSHLIVGGSWDIFHAGHRYILLTAFETGKEVDVGIASQEMLEAKLGAPPEDSFKERIEKLENFLEKFGLRNRARIIEIDDIYGNALEEGETLLVTPETLPNGEIINQKRREKGREPLQLETVDKLEAEDGEPISSTRIRSSAIDRNGLLT